MKVISWTEDQARYELYERLRLAKEARLPLEPQWKENEEILYNAIGYRDNVTGVEYEAQQSLGLDDDGDESGRFEVSINFVFKHWRFIHAQMSSNPPTVQIAPTSHDHEDKAAAEAADNIVNFLRTKHNMQERWDEVAGKCLSKGTGWIKIHWNPFTGKLKDFNEETGELNMSGDIDIYSPSTWDVWADPDAKSSDTMRFVFELITIPLEEAISMFPEAEKDLRGYAKSRENSGTSFFRSRKANNKGDRELIDIYEYHEKALPINGMVGRHAYHLEDGTLLRPMQKNPHYKGQLPLIPLTDVDVEDQVYGKSFIEYETPIQDTLNRIYGALYDNVRAAGNVRWYEPDGCDIDDDSISDLPHERIRGKGSERPTFINPPSSMPDMVRLMEKLESGGDTTAGVNESMVGEVNRRMSGFSIQTAINAGNQVRRRLFNKYSRAVELCYQHALGLVQENWSLKETIKVTGKGGAVQVVSYKGADIASGWDLTASYGESWSLDPASRREEIMQLMPHLKEAGWSMQSILSELRLNEVRGIHDRLSLAANYQGEIFQEMIARYKNGTPILIAPKEYEDHDGMLEYAMQFVMEPEFRQLEEGLQTLIREHIRQREAMANADQMAQQGNPSAAMAGPAPMMGQQMVGQGAPAPAMDADVPIPQPAPVPQK